MYTILSGSISSRIYLRLISNIRPSNSLSFYYLKVPVLKRILGSTSTS
jgi:hypothetical protein